LKPDDIYNKKSDKENINPHKVRRKGNEDEGKNGKNEKDEHKNCMSSFQSVGLSDKKAPYHLDEVFFPAMVVKDVHIFSFHKSRGPF